MDSIPFSRARDTKYTNNDATVTTPPLSIRLTLSFSRALRKAARWLERLADRLDTWARIRSLRSGQRHAFDTITLTPIGTGQPLTATRDARSRVVALTDNTTTGTGSDRASVNAGVR